MARLIEKPQLKLTLPKLETLNTSGGAWSLYDDEIENYIHVTNVFTNSELDAIINIGNYTELAAASTLGPRNLDIRNSFVRFLYPNNFTSWIFQKLSDVIRSANDQYFQFKLTSMEQGLQFTRYQAPGQHYDWHLDRGRLVGIRKLSLVIQLSDPNHYEGGDLQLMVSGDPTNLSRERGTISIFPSFVLHRVTPVTSGTRYSLVCWVSGPKFE